VNVRPLSAFESSNLACLNRAGKSSALLFLTPTGLSKSILDATEPIRQLLLNEGIHDYSVQGQGEANKRIIEAIFHGDTAMLPMSASLYRPSTKNGDPRIWFSGLPRQARPDDVCAVFVHKRSIHLLNLTRSQLASQVRKAVATPLTAFFSALTAVSSKIAEELLSKLRSIASTGPIPASCEGSTSVGRSIETALGIEINSSRDPDYKGIEIKSGRSAIQGRENRATLFACVPDWKISQCRSSREILEKFGYQRGSEFKLYCTISSRRPNSQGLIFEFQDAERHLSEVCKIPSDQEVAVWKLSKLENSLLEKHRETFWVKAHSVTIRGQEFFELRSVMHTCNPNIPQLERMLRDGSITMDHLIKRQPNGGAREKGPLFKIHRPRLPELFLGEPQFYQLS
jgi:hypothetical protein